MGQYVTLTMRTNIYHEIIDALMTYCSDLNNYWDMESAVHLIDALDELYHEDMIKQNIEYKQYLEYEQLFKERFENEGFKDKNGDINEDGMYEYKNFNKVNRVIEDYKEGGVLDILDEKHQFFLVLSLLDAVREKQ